ncbi:MAG: hypothetical protein QOH88_1730 [Verrucomicrobiota bacterium]
MSFSVETRSEWTEWSAYNLALGIPEQKVTAQLSANGFAANDAARLLRRIKRNPVFSATLKAANNLKKWIALNEALLELEKQRFNFSEIPCVSGLSSTAFHRDYYCANRPVVLNDVADKWPAMKKWNLDFFRKKLGDELVKYQSGRSHKDHRDSFTDHTVETKFSNYLNILGRKDCPSNCYLIAHDHLLEREPFKILLRDIVFDKRYLDGADIDGRVFFWLGPKGSMTPMHRDLGNVYLAQIRGRKSIKLIPSKQLHLVYNESGYYSDVDFERFSYDDFPLLRRAHISEVILNPGQMLFIPIGWWHHVKSLDRTISITGNNFRFNNRMKAIF